MTRLGIHTILCVKVGIRHTHLEDEPTAKEQHPITGKVTVHRISTDQTITYSAGHLSTWVTEFEIDLHDGKFDQS